MDYIIKKTVVFLLFPMPLFWLLMVAGIALAFSRRRKRRRVGKRLLIILAVVYYLAGTMGYLPYWELSRRYEPLIPDTLPADTYVICVTGSGFTAEAPLEMLNFTEEARMRAYEGARIASSLEAREMDYTVAISIPGPTGREVKVNAVYELYSLYGIPPEKIKCLTNAVNTGNEVSWFKSFTGKKILITGGYHMPRLMQIARRAGLDAIAAPSLVPYPPVNELVSFIPYVDNVYFLTKAVYEYLGMVKYAFKGGDGG